MSQILINILENQQVFSLVGNLDVLLNKRRVRIYLKDFLHAIISEKEILVPYEEADQESLLKDIQVGTTN
jgi:hypothetical protein